MLKSLEIAGPSCLTRAADDEPIFVLRANDELASSVVRFWAARYIATKRSQSVGGHLTEAQQAKYDEAMAIAAQIDAWRQLRG